jgi:hypothetical protein
MSVVRVAIVGLSVILIGVMSDPRDVLAADAAASGARRALIVCGLSGDDAHHKQFAETIVKLRDGLIGPLAFDSADVEVLFGDEPVDADPDLIRMAARATREALEQQAQALRNRTDADDAVWVIVLGHSHYDGRQAWLNLPGPDLNQAEFAKLFEGLVAREQVFVITTPTSGFAIKSLSAEGRVVITATEADWETNETEFPHEFARLLANLAMEENLDADKDGRVSLFDLYITTVRNLAQSYLERELLATEHALLDDDGNGRGTEVQIDFLTVDQGGRLQPNRPSIRPAVSNGDGVLSRTLILRPVQ